MVLSVPLAKQCNSHAIMFHRKFTTKNQRFPGAVAWTARQNVGLDVIFTHYGNILNR